MMLPAALVGRPLSDLLTVYLSQAGSYKSLSKHAPNLYVFISNDYYSLALPLGLAVAMTIMLAWVFIYARSSRPLLPSRILLYGLASVGMLPFFLPKMHDRYFYPADVLSFLVASAYPHLWYLAVGYQLVSGLVYSNFLGASLVALPRGVQDATLYIAASLNTLLTALLLWVQWKTLNEAYEPST
jgi:Gpi18-like mannosyltransferase